MAKVERLMGLMPGQVVEQVPTGSLESQLPNKAACIPWVPPLKVQLEGITVISTIAVPLATKATNLGLLVMEKGALQMEVCGNTR
jgi:hypothetical protein